MLTIIAMVRVGPWTLLQVDRVRDWTKCERCPVRIKEVWVCEVDEGHDLAVLDGKRRWRIGSTCGPTLMQVSDEKWNQETMLVGKRVKLAVRLVTLLETARARGVSLTDFFTEVQEPLRNGTLDDFGMRRLGNMLPHFERQLGLRKPL